MEKLTVSAPPNTIAQEFKSLFGPQPDGCDLEVVLHSDKSSRIVDLCRGGMDLLGPAILLEYFEQWELSTPDPRAARPSKKPWFVVEQLILNGRWEAGWSVARLYLDQVMKQESATGDRYPKKGHVLCSLALAGSRLGCPALVRHYAQLSSAGDFCREAGPEPPGLGPVLMEPHESHLLHAEWRRSVGSWLSNNASRPPVFLEAYLAARWFRGSHQETIIKLAELKMGAPASFVEFLFQAGPNCRSSTEQGTVFEAAAGLLLSATPGFTVYPCRSNKGEQIDLVVYYEPDAVAPPCLPRGFGLVECKSVKDEVPSSELRNFGMKCLLRRVQFGILIARSNITGSGPTFDDPVGAKLTRMRFQNDGLTILVLDINDLRGRDRELRGLHDALLDDYHRLVFGKIVGE